MITSSRTRLRALGVLLSLFALVPAAQAQAPRAAPYEPVRGQAGKDVIWIASPDSVVERMLQMAEVKAEDLVVDLGSGDGKIPIAAARLHGARAEGLEYNPKLVELSVQRAREAGLAEKISFKQADIFVTDFSRATVVTMYLLPELNLRLRPTLFAMAPGTRVVSHSFTMGDWQPDETARIGSGELFLWHVPANASGTWRVTAPGLGGAPQTLRLAQRFQVVQGDAIFGDLQAGVIRPRLAGAAFEFGLRDTSGVPLAFSARIAGDRMTGTVTRRGQAPVPFEAVRAAAAEPIEGVSATVEEMNAARRALDAR